ncbi:MAG: TIGR02266 family protein, partial [Myxococcales bacterium]
LEVLRDLLFAGKLRSNMHVSRDGSGWAPVSSYPELVDLLTPRAEADARAEERKEALKLKAQLADWKSKPIHEVFKLPADARPEQFRAAFFKLVKRYYPDRLAPDAAPELREVYQQIFQLFSQLMISIETRATHGPKREEPEPAKPAPQPAAPPRASPARHTFNSAEFVGFERRGLDRVLATIRVTSESAGIFTEHRTVNLSSGGVFIAGAQVYPLGTQIDLVFHFEDVKREIRAAGKVVWENAVDDGKQPRGFGVRFTTISENDRLFLFEFVDALRAR